MTPHGSGARAITPDAAQKIECPHQATAFSQQSSGSPTGRGSAARNTPATRDVFELIPGGIQRSQPAVGACDFCVTRVTGGFPFEARPFAMSLELPSHPDFRVCVEQRWWCACATCAQRVWVFDWAAIVERHCDVARAEWSLWRREDLAQLFEQLDDTLTGRWSTWSMAGTA